MLTRGRECMNVHCPYRDSDSEYSCQKTKEDSTIVEVSGYPTVIEACPDKVMRMVTRTRTIIGEE